MKDIVLPVTCYQIKIGLMILPLPLFLLGIFTGNVIATAFGTVGLILDAVILFVIFLLAWANYDLPRFPIRCKCND